MYTSLKVCGNKMVYTILSFFQVLQATHGASAVLPKALTNVLNSQACHGKLSFHYLWQSPKNPSTHLYLII